jgi:crotonobetainyl-CoA:carnitine CoA-transferase CaiB-like acyl-CoA transferase
VDNRDANTRTDLQGIKVLELASVLAGPSVGTFLAELGAEVTKVENLRTKGDVTRSWKLPSEPEEQKHSAYFCSVNWGKRHLFLDLKSEEGHAEAMQLAKAADIIITNFKPGDDKKLRLDPLTVMAVNPNVIYGSITGYGEDDPRAAYDVVLQAEAGYMAMNGFADRPPLKFPLAIIDILAAHQLKEGLLLALYNKTRTGKGVHVTTSLFAAAVSALSNYATNWLMGGQLATRAASVHPNICPYGEIITCKDGNMIVLAVGSDRQFVSLCEALGCTEISSDPRFSTVQHRVANREQLMELLRSAALCLTANSLLENLHDRFVPAGAIRNLKEVFELPSSQHLLLHETMADGSHTVRPAQVAFRLD